MTNSVRQSFTNYRSRSSFALPAGSSVIYGSASVEDRALLSNEWRFMESTRHAYFVEVSELASDVVNFKKLTESVILELTNQQSLKEAIQGLPQPIYIDITGLSFGVWASIIRAAVACDVAVFAVYIEPSSYIRTVSPLGVQKYNLSDRTLGVAPIPGFASLRTSRDNDILVPLLGFEGDRLARILEDVQPNSDAMYPIVGLPGFRPEYPYLSIDSNWYYIAEQNSVKNILYAQANCPFSLYSKLEELSQALPNRHFQLAVLGTKPHALGAALFAMQNPRMATILYDHPIRSPRRTDGVARICIYDILGFVHG